MYGWYLLMFQKSPQWLHFKAEFWTTETPQLTHRLFKDRNFFTKEPKNNRNQHFQSFHTFFNVILQKNYKKIEKSRKNEYRNSFRCQLPPLQPFFGALPKLFAARTAKKGKITLNHMI